MRTEPVTGVSTYAETLGNVLSATFDGDTINIVIDNGEEPNDDNLEIKVLETDLIRFNYSPNSVPSSPSTPMIDSNRVWQPVDANVDVNTDPITISTDAIRKLFIILQLVACR